MPNPPSPLELRSHSFYLLILEPQKMFLLVGPLVEELFFGFAFGKIGSVQTKIYSSLSLSDTHFLSLSNSLSDLFSFLAHVRGIGESLI